MWTRQIRAQTKVWLMSLIQESESILRSQIKSRTTLFCSFGDLTVSSSFTIINSSKRNFIHPHKDQISVRWHNSLRGPRTPPLPEASDYQFCTPPSPLATGLVFGASSQIPASQRRWHGIQNPGWIMLPRFGFAVYAMQPSQPDFWIEIRAEHSTPLEPVWDSLLQSERSESQTCREHGRGLIPQVTRFKVRP